MAPDKLLALRNLSYLNWIFLLKRTMLDNVRTPAILVRTYFGENDDDGVGRLRFLVVAVDARAEQRSEPKFLSSPFRPFERNFAARSSTLFSACRRRK